MIVSVLIENGKRILHYSDQSLCIRQIETGRVYESAVDVLPCAYTYEETDQPIEDMDTEATEADYLAALDKLGVSAND